MIAVLTFNRCVQKAMTNFTVNGYSIIRSSKSKLEDLYFLKDR